MLANEERSDLLSFLLSKGKEVDPFHDANII